MIVNIIKFKLFIIDYFIDKFILLIYYNLLLIFIVKFDIFY